MHGIKPTIDRTNLLYHLGLLTRRWRQLLDSEFRSAGLTDATWRPLLHLHILGNGVRQKELAASIGIEGPSLVRLLDTLIAKELIERFEDVADRRAKRLCLTPTGEALVSHIHDTVTTLETGLLSSFSEREISQLADLVLRLATTVNDARKRCKR